MDDASPEKPVRWEIVSCRTARVRLLEDGAGAPFVGGGRLGVPWISTKPGVPYFVTDPGAPWTPIGHNDAVTWPELAGLFRRRDLEGVEAHLRHLKAQGITCVRLMLEYCQGEHRYIERPVGRFPPNMVRLWDDLFAILERIGLHVLLTPFDTFFMWIRWRHHPFNARNGGPCASRRQLLTCAATREAVKARLAFASDRWGHSPALFAWDLWNEIHPAHAGDDPDAIAGFIDDVGPWLRAREIARHGRSHLQTVSIFGPELLRHAQLAEPIFRHPSLDFANTHLYESRTIDDPRDTVAPALAVGRLMRAAVEDSRDGRPVFDSEHGPIHRFKDKRRNLPEPFDDEYFRHIQWAHLASGGAGGGMRWPNRHPHVLTHGMRRAQKALSGFLPLVRWSEFRRRNLNHEIQLSAKEVAAFGCGDGAQAIVWLLRTEALSARGMIREDAPPLVLDLTVPGLDTGGYQVVFYDTVAGTVLERRQVRLASGPLHLQGVPVTRDLALAITRM
jgi:mannan endo-1,4-beta-mannosidase